MGRRVIGGISGLYSSGHGTLASPYILSSSSDIENLTIDGCGNTASFDCSKHFKLENNINLSGVTNFQIGSEDNPFTGVFDGNNKTISNYTNNRSNENYVGFFSKLDNGGEIKNLTLSDVNVIGKEYAGGIVGYVDDGFLQNVHVSSGSIAGRYKVASIAGYLGSSGRLEQASSSATIEGANFFSWVCAGGIVGYNTGIISQTTFKGLVSGNSRIGGIAGCNDGYVTYSYSTGSITGDICGGIVGDNTKFVSNVFATGLLTCDISEHGCSVVSGNGENRNCFFDHDTNGLGLGGNTTAEMKTLTTYTLLGDNTLRPWDFSSITDDSADIWVLNVGEYPSLWFENSSTLAAPSYSGGDGSKESPYLISTAEDLFNIGRNPRVMNAHFKLTDNIDMSFYDGSTAARTISTIGSLGYPFNGVIDGNGKEVSNLTLDNANYSYLAFIAHLAPAGIIKNISLTSTTIIGSSVLAGLVALNFGTIENSSVSGTLTGNNYVGLLVAANSGGTITDSYTDGTINGGNYTGGLIGIGDGIYSRSYTTANVTGATYVGGFIGRNFCSLTYCNSVSPTIVTDSYAAGDVDGTGNVGGFIERALNITFTNCYQSGTVTTTGSGGAFAQDEFNTTITNSYFNTSTGGIVTSALGTGKTAAELRTETTFIDWDFQSVWDITDGVGFPTLK